MKKKKKSTKIYIRGETLTVDDSRYPSMVCSLILSGVAISIPNCNSIQRSKSDGAQLFVASSASNLRVSSRLRCSQRGPFHFTSVWCSATSSEPQSNEDDEDPQSPKPLRVPDHWLDPLRASQVPPCFYCAFVFFFCLFFLGDAVVLRKVVLERLKLESVSGPNLGYVT